MVNKNFVIVTGLSGAGKTQAAHILEDLGFFCVDNLPAPLIPQFTQICSKVEPSIKKVALVVDVREGKFFADLFTSLDVLKNNGISYRILFLEAENNVLINRFKETRRLHPLKKEGTISKSINKEKVMLSKIRSKADYIIDTSNFTIWDLKQKITEIFKEDRNERMLINIISFGYKFGLPQESDIIFDVRFLPNPNYQEHLAELTGKDRKAKEFVLNNKITKEFLKKVFNLLNFTIPYHIKEGKNVLNIGIGCTGGRHRAVVIADKIANFLKNKKYKVEVFHRDLIKK